MTTSRFNSVASRATSILNRIGTSSIFTIDSIKSMDDGVMVWFFSSSGARFGCDWMISSNHLITVFVNDEFVVDDADASTAETALVRALSILEARWLSR